MDASRNEILVAQAAYADVQQDRDHQKERYKAVSEELQTLKRTYNQAKFDKLAKEYSTLRDEHQSLLTSYQNAQDQKNTETIRLAKKVRLIQVSSLQSLEY